MGWPDSPYLWRENAKPAQEQYTAVAKAISQFEPLTMLANTEVRLIFMLHSAHPSQLQVILWFSRLLLKLLVFWRLGRQSAGNEMVKMLIHTMSLPRSCVTICECTQELLNDKPACLTCRQTCAAQSADEARAAFADAPNVTVVEVPINDGWARDWGPSVRRAATALPPCSHVCSLLSINCWVMGNPYALCKHG